MINTKDIRDLRVTLLNREFDDSDVRALIDALENAHALLRQCSGALRMFKEVADMDMASLRARIAMAIGESIT